MMGNHWLDLRHSFIRVSLTLAVLCLCSAQVLSQEEGYDVVELGNGDTITGRIIEILPSKSVKIESSDGQIYILDITTVTRIYQSQKAQSSGTVEQNPDLGISSSALRDYERQKLSLELRGQSIGSIAQQGLASFSTWRKWEAYQGFTSIEESEFFLITGYPEEAAKASSYATWTGVLTWGGLAAATIGTIMLVANDNHHIGPGGDDTFGIAGAVIGITGVGSMMVGLFRGGNNWAPYSTVDGIARQYNESLLNQIKANH